MKLFQNGFHTLNKIEVDMKLVDEAAVAPVSNDLGDFFD